MAKMTGREALIHILKQEGVKYIFGIPGATEVFFMDAIEKCPDLKYILGLNEVVCVGMAEGYARTTGKPGFLNLHTNTGLSASLAMLLNAHKGGVPIVVTAGQQDTRLLLRDPALSGDLVEIARPFTKWSAEVLYAEDIPMAIQRAFKIAMQPPTGPVFISLPQNTLVDTLDFEYKPNTPSLYKLRPDKEAIRLAIEIIIKAKKPLIIVESGVTKSNALSEIVTFAELIGAPVYQTWMSDVNFPVNHPQYLGTLDPSDPKAREILSGFDVLIGVGVPLFREAIYSPHPVIPKHMKIIQIDDDPWEIGKNFPVSCGILAHIRETLIELNDRLKEEMTVQKKEEVSLRIKEITKEKQAMESMFLKKAEEDRDLIPISVRRFVMELKAALKPGTLVVDDCWSSSGILQRGIGFSEALSFQRARGGGSIGWGLPGSLGVKLGAPDRPVVAVCGDGSAMWSIQSLWTASHYHIPVTFIILSNATYAQVKVMRKRILGGDVSERHEGMELDQPEVDFTLLAKSMGIKAQKVDNPDKLYDVLKSSFDTDEPQLLEILIQKTPPI